MADAGQEPPRNKVMERMIPPGLGLRPPFPLDPAQGRILLLVGLAMTVNAYDQGLYGLALPQISAELNWPQDELGSALGLARLGVVPALALAVLADTIGRRRLLMFTIVATGIFAFLSAFAQTPEQFVAAQFGVKFFAYGEEAIAIVMITEIIDTRLRGWAIGALAALAALGNGLSAGLYGAVDVLPYGWRALYVIGAVPLLLLAYLRRNLPETERYEAHKQGHEPVGNAFMNALQPLIIMVRTYPRRVLALAAAVIPFGFATTAAIIFNSTQLQTVHGFAPGDVSLIYVAGGTFAITGNLLAGRLSDKIGRRKTLAGAISICAICLAFLFGTVPGDIIILAWIGAIFGLFAAEAIFNALGAELFPTSFRSTSSTLRVICYTAAGSAGLFFESELYSFFGNHGEAMLVLLATAPIAVLVVLFALPESAGQELEVVAPERG